jgi:hypothetical protein
MNQLFFNAFILYSKLHTNITQLFKSIYETEDSVKYFVDDMCYFFKYLKSFAYGNKIEPYYTSWICVCSTSETYALNEEYNPYKSTFQNIDYDSNVFLESTLFDDPIDDLMNNEEYEIKKFNSKNEWYENTFNGEFDKCMTDINNFEYEEALVLVKHPENNAIISNVICYNNVKKPLVFHPPSNVKFLSVKYSHPNMKESIFLELDADYFIVGNEILSNVFILRMLKYQTQSYVFDDNYKLEIIDNNINIKTLNYDNYILLEEKDYKVKEYVYADDDDSDFDEKVHIIENDEDDIYVVDELDAEIQEIRSDELLAKSNEDAILSAVNYEGLDLGMDFGLSLYKTSSVNDMDSYVLNKND